MDSRAHCSAYVAAHPWRNFCESVEAAPISAVRSGIASLSFFLSSVALKGASLSIRRKVIKKTWDIVARVAFFARLLLFSVILGLGSSLFSIFSFIFAVLALCVYYYILVQSHIWVLRDQRLLVTLCRHVQHFTLRISEVTPGSMSCC